MSDIHEVGSTKEIKRKKFLDELSKKGFIIKVRGSRYGYLLRNARSVKKMASKGRLKKDN